MTEQLHFIKAEPHETNDSDNEPVICAKDILFEAKIEPVFDIKREHDTDDFVKEEKFHADETNDTKNNNDECFKINGEVHRLKDGKVVLEKLDLETPKSTVFNQERRKKSKSRKLFLSNVHMTFENSFDRICDNCDKSFKFSMSAMKKIAKCSNCKATLQFQCRKCNTVFNTCSNLRRHYSFCGREPDLQCHVCPYKTRHQRNLDRHVEIHSKPKVDNEIGQPAGHIFKYFQRYCSKCDEVIEHSGIKCFRTCKICNTDLNFICLKCNKKKVTYRQMYWHLKTKCQSTEKKTSCSNCGKTLKGNFIHIKKHIRYCTKKLEFKCDYCKLMTKYKYELKLHIIKKHLKSKQK